MNLRERFGWQYRVEHEESYYAQHGHHARVVDPWLMVIPCVHGHIYPHGGNMLAASVDGHPNVAGALRRLKCCRVQQNGDFGELTVLFDVADFAKVAAVMRPKRRRVMSEAQKAQLVAARSRSPIGNRVEKGGLTERQCVPSPLDDQKTIQPAETQNCPMEVPFV